LWIAALASNVGYWMQNVGAVWLMTRLSSSAVLVALVQTATSLPVMLVGLPAGALADVVDRRRLLLVTQTWMLASAAALALLTLAGLATPWLVLAFTFLLGLGNAVNAPAWQAVIPELVGPEQTSAAVALNSVQFNIGRALGPALGGLLVAVAGPEAVFALNALSFLGVIFVLWRWRRPEQDVIGGGERVLGAIGSGLRYLRHAPPLRAVLYRTSLFILPASALWALLPLVATRELGLGATGYGVLLGGLGAGSIGGAAILPKVRSRFPIDLRLVAGTLLLAGALLVLALVRSVPPVFAAMLAAGLAWVSVLTSFNVATRAAVPRWVQARALAVYLLVFQGGLALGSLVWGLAAARLGDTGALLLAVAALLAGLVGTLRWRLQAIGTFDLSPSVRPEPEVAVEPEPDDGPVLVLVEYRIAPSRAEEFAVAMRALRRVRRRDGAYRWGFWADVVDPSRYVETFVVRSWAEHLRQHERFTVEDLLVRDRVQSFHVGEEPPAVSHLVHPDAAIGRQRHWVRWTRPGTRGRSASERA
ncbi:MAG TPA: MFS transporter, partial [Actinomycetota bacterium]|nr:MFS transporter [Actinomycetota bacterium]